jgi:FkbM family methyltransferase
MTEYQFTLEAISTPVPMHSHGKVFTIIVCPDSLWHPSIWSFLDELPTRESWWNISEGDVVLDIGADFGSYTLSALAQGAGHVLAWSPPFKLPEEPIEAAVLTRSVCHNGWGDRLTVFTSGLWSKTGYLAAYDGPRMARWFPTPEEARSAIDGQPGHCATFPVGTLDELGLTKCDWIKIDTEGAELDILHGGRETIARCRPRILLENHTHLDPNCEEKCTAFLAELGYRHVGTRPHHTISHSLYEPEETDHL